MKVFVLKSDFGTFTVSEVIETSEMFLVPVPNTYEYTQYSKKLYTLEIKDAKKIATEDR
jgi:hypothetical protein